MCHELACCLCNHIKACWKPVRFDGEGTQCKHGMRFLSFAKSKFTPIARMIVSITIMDTRDVQKKTSPRSVPPFSLIQVELVQNNIWHFLYLYCSLYGYQRKASHAAPRPQSPCDLHPKGAYICIYLHTFCKVCDRTSWHQILFNRLLSFRFSFCTLLAWAKQCHDPEPAFALSCRVQWGWVSKTWERNIF